VTKHVEKTPSEPLKVAESHFSESFNQASRPTEHSKKVQIKDVPVQTHHFNEHAPVSFAPAKEHVTDRQKSTLKSKSQSQSKPGLRFKSESRSVYTQAWTEEYQPKERVFYPSEHLLKQPLQPTTRSVSIQANREPEAEADIGFSTGRRTQLTSSVAHAGTQHNYDSHTPADNNVQENGIFAGWAKSWSCKY
jgi:hypothetical protein